MKRASALTKVTAVLVLAIYGSASLFSNWAHSFSHEHEAHHSDHDVSHDVFSEVEHDDCAFCDLALLKSATLSESDINHHGELAVLTVHVHCRVDISLKSSLHAPRGPPSFA